MLLLIWANLDKTCHTFVKLLICSSLGAGKRNAQKGGRVGLTKNKDGSVQLPETTCRVDIKVARSINCSYCLHKGRLKIQEN